MMFESLRFWGRRPVGSSMMIGSCFMTCRCLLNLVSSVLCKALRMLDFC